MQLERSSIRIDRLLRVATVGQCSPEPIPQQKVLKVVQDVVSMALPR